MRFALRQALLKQCANDSEITWRSRFVPDHSLPTKTNSVHEGKLFSPIFFTHDISTKEMMFTFLLLCKIWLTSLSVQPAFATIRCSRGVINLSSVNEYWSSVKKSMSRDVTIPTKTPPRHPLSGAQSINHRLREDRQIHNRLQISKLLLRKFLRWNKFQNSTTLSRV